MIKEFHDRKQKNAHALFQKWRENQPEGFILNVQSSKRGLIHRVDCLHHLGNTDWREADEGASLTRKKKVCSASIQALQAWASAHEMKAVTCNHCVNTALESHLPQTWLVTWNPAKMPWDELDENIAELSDRGFFVMPWTFVSKQVQAGDRVFLLRQGKTQRGIVGSGWAVSRTYPDTSYDGSGKLMNFVRVRWDMLLNPAVEPILPRSALDAPALQPMHWDTQGSGISIKREIASALDKVWRAFLTERGYTSINFANEVNEADQPWEGAVRPVLVNAYERSPYARQKCINEYGYDCAVCGMNFAKVYGDLGKDFIHVHHLKQISSIGEKYRIDPVKDLRPVCPNCHAMLHRQTPPISIDSLKKVYRR